MSSRNPIIRKNTERMGSTVTKALKRPKVWFWYGLHGLEMSPKALALVTASVLFCTPSFP